MEDKLQRGLRQLAEAGHDKDKLGMSLISLHGALEEYFRSQLAAEIALDENEQGRRRTDWQDLLNLWQRHRSLSYRDRELVFAKNSKRNAVAHGDPFEISQNEMEQYARFVQDFMGVRVTSRPVYKPPVQSAPRVKSTPPSLSQSSPPQGPMPVRSLPKAKWSCRRRLAVMFIVLLISASLPFLSLPELLDSLISSIQAESEMIQEEAVELLPDFEGDEVPAVENETAVTATPSSNTKTAPDKTRIQTIGTSNVRSDPDVKSPIIGYTYHEEEYDVIETNADETWYKIRLEDGTEGWIGFSRVKVLSP